MNVKLRVREIARRSGISVSGVSRLLRGKRMPRMNTAVKLAKGMGLTLDELMKQLPAGPV